MKIKDGMFGFQAGFYGIVQIDAKHSGQINGIHVNGINVIRDIDMHFDILVDGQEQFGIQNTFQLQKTDMQQVVQCCVFLCEIFLHWQNMLVEKGCQFLIPFLINICGEGGHDIDIIMSERTQVIIDHFQVLCVFI